jgi:hypothetical protein
MRVIAVAALLLATLFTGAAVYISLVEQPARLELDDASLLAQWQPSYKRALPIQAGLAVAGGLAGLAQWYLSGDWRWLVGSLALLANWPFTLLAIMPVNKSLMALEPRRAGPEGRRKLLLWGKLHNGRSALGGIAALLYAWALVCAG